jgi:hypothetical protein
MRLSRTCSARLGSRSSGRVIVLAGLLALTGLPVLVGPAPARADPTPLAVCGNRGPARGPVRHVILLMLENHSYSQVVGSPDAPYQTSLAAQCGSAPTMFGITHSSAANYLAVSAREYPQSSPPGCRKVAACADASDNLHHQLNAAGLTWRGYVESMPSRARPARAAATRSAITPSCSNRPHQRAVPGWRLAGR